VPGEEVAVMVVAVVPEMKMMAMVMVAEVRTAKMVTVAAARGRVTRGRQRGGERNHGNGSREDNTRGGHGFSLWDVSGDQASVRNKETRPGEYDRAGPSSRPAYMTGG
jgi:hypothetical protein